MSWINLNGKVVIVTGGAGLIGSAMIWGINNRNLNNVISVDDYETGSLKERNLAPLVFKDRSRLRTLEIFFVNKVPN